MAARIYATATNIMTTNIYFATAKNMVENVATLANVWNAETAAANGLEIVTSWTADDHKRARRQIYDLTRMLRGEIANGVNLDAIPAEIANVTNGKKLDKSNTDFGTNKTANKLRPIVDDGILSIMCDGLNAYCWRACAPVEKPTKTDKTAATDTATEKPAKKNTTKTTAATVKQYRCKNLPANRAALTNAMVLYTEMGDFLTFETDAKTLKLTKIKTMK